MREGVGEGQKKEEKEFSGIRTVGTVYILDWWMYNEEKDWTSEEKEVVISIWKTRNCFRSSEGKIFIVGWNI